MKLLQKSVLTLALIVLPFIIFSQSHDHSKCGTSQADQALIKARLMENRRIIMNQTVSQRNSNSTKYIPVTFQIVGDNDGNGYVNAKKVLDMLCDLNNDFADQNIVFFMNDEMRSIVSSTHSSVEAIPDSSRDSISTP